MPLANIQGKFIVRPGSGGVPTPSQPTISSVTPTSFVASWGAVANAIAYRLDVATDSEFTSFVSGFNNKAVAGTSDTVTGLSAETTYYVRVRAVTAGASSSSASQATEAQTSTLTEGLLAFYKLEDLTDSSGNGNTLTNNGGVTFSSGKIGNAAVFEQGRYLTSSLRASAWSAGSISIWLKYSVTPALAATFGYNEGGNKRFSIHIYQDGNIYFLTPDGQGWQQPSIPGVNDNEWHHLVHVFDANNIYIWLDGVLYNTVPRNNATALTTTEDFSLNYDIDASVSDFIGSADAAGVWNRALSNTEISELYNAGAGLEIN